MFNELNQQLIQYKKSNSLQRQAILLDLVKELTEAQNSNPQSQEELIVALKRLVFARAMLQNIQHADFEKPNQKTQTTTPKRKIMVCSTFDKRFLLEENEGKFSFLQAPEDVSDHETMRYWIELYIKNTQYNLLKYTESYYALVNEVEMSAVINKVITSEAWPKDFPSIEGLTLTQIIDLIDERIKSCDDKENIKAYARLRAQLIFETFQLTTLYPELVTWAKQHITNTSSEDLSVLYYNFSCELDWYMNCLSIHSSIPPNAQLASMTLLQALEKGDAFDYNDLLMMLINDIKGFNLEKSLYSNKYFNADAYNAACTNIIVDAKAQFDSFKVENIDLLWTDAFAQLAHSTAKLPTKKRLDIKNAAEVLKEAISLTDTSSEEKNNAYDLFVERCNEILDGKHPTIMKSVFTIFAVVVASVLTFAVGFTLGFLFGMWTGPGAFISALVGGCLAATVVASSAAGTGLFAGGVAAFGVFGEKKHVAVDDFVEGVQVIDASTTTPSETGPGF